MDPQIPKSSNPTANLLLLILNCILLAFGTTGGPLILRLYFLHGGERLWFSAWLETGGWPVIIIPLVIAYFHRRKTQGHNAKLLTITPKLCIAFVVIGVLTGLDDFFYAHGMEKLPVSTSQILIATQLAFTSFFAYLLVRQKFTPYSINAIVLLTVGAAVLAMHSSSDRPKGVTKGDYYGGFSMTLAASALYGFVLPLIELTYLKSKKIITYTLVMEVQLIMCFSATAFCTVGMLVNKDFQFMLTVVSVSVLRLERRGHSAFRPIVAAVVVANRALGKGLIAVLLRSCTEPVQAIPREAKNYTLGEFKYYMVLVWSAISWQCFFLGAVGVIFCASSLLSGIIIAVMIPVTEILGVLFYKESFKVEKGLASGLALWGLVSYFYGEMKQSKKKKKSSDKDQIELSEDIP